MAADVQRTEAQLAATPPMGWNSWNHFGPHVADKDIRAAADAIASNGMKKAGYIYVNIDDGWQGQRDDSGRLQPNANFPDMKALAAYVHSKGLKLGIYTTPGPTSCARFAGSMGHVEQDAQTFAEWQIDYVKYDICSFRDVLATQAHGDPEISKHLLYQAYSAMSAAIRKSGRPMVLSMSEHGIDDVWGWGAQAGAQLWRTGDDIRNSYESVTAIGFAQAGLSPYAGVGHWNDPDMLEIGNGRLDEEEARTQMSLWALLSAPLLAGNDLSQISPETLNILTNAEVIAVDQDPAGKQGDRAWTEGPIEIWTKPLQDGSTAVGIFSRNAGPDWITLDLKKLGLPADVSARDLWLSRQLDPIHGARSFLVPRHGVVLLKITRLTNSCANQPGSLPEPCPNASAVP